jgi:hypothetical protein
MLQAERSQVGVPRSLNFTNVPNSSSCTMAPRFTQLLTEMSSLPVDISRGKERPARMADNLTAIYEPIV